MQSGLKQLLNDVRVEEIIRKYCGEKVDVDDQGAWLVLDPCPRCGHRGCAKINTSDNTLVCWSDCKAFYLTPVKVVQWLFNESEQVAMLKLAEDFDITLPDDWERQYQEYQKEKRQQIILSRFAELCHEQLGEEGRRYWREQRGFTDELIDRFKIGICRGNSDTYQVLLKEGFGEEELRESRLFQYDGTEAFCFRLKPTNQVFPYYTIPNQYRNKVVDIHSRCIGNSDKEHLIPKYRNRYGAIDHAFNPGALDNDVVILCEGITDTLSLIQMGFENTAGTFGVSVIKEEWIDRLKKKRAVYILFDTDAPGRKSTYELARQIGETAKIVILTEVKDTNELLVKHGIEAAKGIVGELIKSAKTALQIDIESLPKEFEQVEDEAIKEIAFQILDFIPTRQEHYKDLLGKHYGKPKSWVDELLKYYKEQKRESRKQGESAEVKIVLNDDPKYIRIGQSFAGGKVQYAQEFEGIKGSGDFEYSVSVIGIVTSDRAILKRPSPITKDEDELVKWEIEGQEYTLRRPLKAATKRWSKTKGEFSIRAFTEGKELKVSPVELYKRIERVFKSHYYTTEMYDYVILGLFTMFTYIYELWDVVPYLYVNGPPDSGKTTICTILENLAFNGDLVSNISTASLFREAEQKQPTLILDEQEQISNRKSNEDKGDYISIIKSAYKRTGTIKRQSTSDPSKTEEFQVFSPLVIANVFGIESILKTRTIQISTRPAPREATDRIIPLRTSDPEIDEMMEMLRSQLYYWVMQEHTTLRILPNFKMDNEAINRAAELFQPLYALATYLEKLDEAQELNLLELLDEGLPSKLFKRESFKERDLGEMLREACVLALEEQGITKSGKGAWIPVYRLLDLLVEINGIHTNAMTPQWIGEYLAGNGLITGRNDRRRIKIKITLRDKKTGTDKDSDIEKEVKATHYFLRYDLIKGNK
ncbi:MAG: toprim domain-containing protein [Firmicutes bacterium]|nr:toprim domain-containing protein [Bacillota bacterium]